MSYMARAKRELCVRVTCGDVPGTVYVNQVSYQISNIILANNSMPQESAASLGTILPILEVVFLSTIPLYEILWYVSHAAVDVSY